MIQIPGLGAESQKRSLNKCSALPDNLFGRLAEICTFTCTFLMQSLTARYKNTLEG
jgi:hypothetical protein